MYLSLSLRAWDCVRFGEAWAALGRKIYLLTAQPAAPHLALHLPLARAPDLASSVELQASG